MIGPTDELPDRQRLACIPLDTHLACQVCGQPLTEGHNITAYAYRAAGEPAYAIGYIMCGADIHEHPTVFTHGVREYVLTGHVGSCTNSQTQSTTFVLLDPTAVVTSPTSTTTSHVRADVSDHTFPARSHADSDEAVRHVAPSRSTAGPRRTDRARRHLREQLRSPTRGRPCAQARPRRPGGRPPTVDHYRRDSIHPNRPHSAKGTATPTPPRRQDSPRRVDTTTHYARSVNPGYAISTDDERGHSSSEPTPAQTAGRVRLSRRPRRLAHRPSNRPHNDNLTPPTDRTVQHTTTLHDMAG